MGRKLSNEDFISKAKKIYGDRYEYSKTEYCGMNKSVLITCPEHGDFHILADNFLHGHGCQKCSGRERITQDVFIKRSTEKHQGRYDYSKVVYKGLKEPVCIICPVHGDFWQQPRYHMNGNGCQKCFATPKSTTEQFIGSARKIYGDKYDYSKVVYTGNKNKVTVICLTHGEWEVTPNNFLRGSECPGCYGTPKYTNEEFIKKAKKIHGEKYDYSKVVYTGNKNKVKIICPVHGEFEQIASAHLNGCGCRACSGNLKITLDTFINRSVENHETRYDYSKVDFINGQEKVCIICPIHGEFWQGVSYHMRGGNCPKCVGGRKLTGEEFISKAKKIHLGKYDYSKVEYKNYATKVCIICPEHGEFWQTPNNHLFGAGCPTCPQSNMEGEIRQQLTKSNIEFVQEKGFDWLRYKKKLFLDFYLPEYRIAIECQGRQHFNPVDIFGGEEFYRKTIERDLIKRELCAQHGISILYYSNAGIEYPYQVYESIKELMKAIKEGSK